jgi:hypothetical protein
LLTLKQDDKAQEILQKLAVAPKSELGNYTLFQGLIKVHGKIWLGDTPELHNRIVSAFHASAMCGHSGFSVTYNRIRSLFRWVDATVH